MPYAKLKDPVIQKVFAKEVVNVFDDREVHAGCAFCAEKWHDKEKAYVNEVVKDGKTILKLTSQWNRMKDQSNGRGMNKHHATLMCKLHDKKEEPAEDALSSEQIYQLQLDDRVRKAQLHVDDRVRKSNDRVTQLGGRRGILFIFYGCIYCQMWTIGSNH